MTRREAMVAILEANPFKQEAMLAVQRLLSQLGYEDGPTHSFVFHRERIANEHLEDMMWEAVFAAEHQEGER